VWTYHLLGSPSETTNYTSDVFIPDIRECTLQKAHRDTNRGCWWGCYSITSYFIELLLFYCLFKSCDSHSQ